MKPGQHPRLLAPSFAAAICAFAATASATEYDLVTLTTSPFTSGEAYGIYQGQAAGGVRWATLWPTISQPVTLDHSGGWLGTVASGVWGNQVVGYGIPASHNERPLLWEGTTASVVDLTPSLGGIGQADATDGAQQVGVANGKVGYSK